jgi:predicted transcriptional regulator
MAVVKTAISLEAGLLGRIDEVARELDVPRSRLLSQAATQFLDRYDSASLLARLNAAHADGPTAEEVDLRAARRASHGRLIRREP